MKLSLILTSLLCLTSFTAFADINLSLYIDSHKTDMVSVIVPKGDTTISIEPDTYSRLSCRFFDPKSGYMGLEQINYSACTGTTGLNSPTRLQIYITNEDKANHRYTVAIKPIK